MLFQSRRLLTDLRRVSGWVVTIALLTFAVAVVATYNAAFGLSEARSGTLSTIEEPTAFLRAVDPGQSIVTRVDSVEELEESVLDEPGLAVLLDRVAQDERMHLALPLNAFALDGRSGLTLDSRITAVVGVAPSFLPSAPTPGTVLLWGSLNGQQAAGLGVSDDGVLGYPVQRVGDQLPRATYVAGDGHREAASGPALVAFDAAIARELGVSYPYHVVEVLDGFACRCETAELEDIADAMTQAEVREGTGRAYYAVDHAQLVGPVERSRAMSEMLNTGHAVLTLLSVACLTVMVAQVFWSRRAHVYRVERLAGSSERVLHVRSQALIAASLTLPALAGVFLVDAVLATAAWPPPLTSGARFGAFALITLLHMLAGSLTAVRLHRLCRS